MQHEQFMQLGMREVIMKKLYIGFSPGLKAIYKIQQFIEAKLGGLAVAKPTPIDRLHVTLAFLGQVSEEYAQTLMSRLAEVPPFTLNFEGLGTFGSRVLHLKVAGGPGMHEARKRLMGEQMWNPHLTLAKVDGRGSDPELVRIKDQEKGLVLDPCIIKHVHLFHRSECLHTVRLGAGQRALIA